MVIVSLKGIDTPFWCYSLLCRCGEDKPRCIKSSTCTHLEDWAEKWTAQKNYLPLSGQQKLLSSQEQQLLTEIPWADSKQAGTSSQCDGGPYRYTRLFWRARRATSASPTGKPSQPPKLPGPAEVSHWHDDIPPSTRATLGISTGCCITRGRGAQRDHSLTDRGQEREERHGALAWGYTAGQPQSQVPSALPSLSLLSTWPHCQTASREFNIQFKPLAHIWLLACCSGGGRQ